MKSAVDPGNYAHSNQPVLEVSGLSFQYPDQLLVLQKVDLKVSMGERIGVIGPNGAGKTTFFMLVCGLLKPVAGKVRVFDKPVVPRDFRPEVGMVFQNPDDQLFCPSVLDDVAFGPRNLGLSEDEVNARVREALEVVGVSDLCHRQPHHLSGGEKRLVAIAGVLAMHPKLVIHDEPTSNLDIRYRRRLICFIQSSQEAMLIASHDLEFILEVCHRVILMDNGCVIAEGNPKEIMGNNELMEAHGLERPHSLIPHAELHHRR
ncbi:MAG: energy-coupling factor ABC transporter ATP-binding protein [Firmicutes bacterium]|nr:energy-coupling factor ABC transporter ATP-binding protein [Bacillota bacterium]MBU4555220.1 energy-coupling factor ABC transporter ATP-binding protein [Bacillota bacterium]MBV1728344.1 energy-coupling factor ABC transporter ATP-binding protein [Desulforudis sp.]MBV1736164.1 energy-coupling factor ABC transporter ATP-binding protein [Desulforudis sp.]MBV1769504.1 energy-coupling factor ABC transporter ATP-binding protein [Desulforudis sp.]